jgi:hypothetical protein
MSITDKINEKEVIKCIASTFCDARTFTFNYFQSSRSYIKVYCIQDIFSTAFV